MARRTAGALQQQHEQDLLVALNLTSPGAGDPVQLHCKGGGAAIPAQVSFIANGPGVHAPGHLLQRPADGVALVPHWRTVD